MPSVSFIIPSYNSHLTIARTLESIFRQERLSDVVQVIVVDSSNDGKTREVFKPYKQSIFELVALHEKTSPSGGRNIGAQRAKGDLLCFIDSDVYLSDDWLEEVLKVYHKGCRAGCGSVSAPDFQQNNKLALAQLYLQFNESLMTGETRPVTMVPACNMFVERMLFFKAGAFPDLRASEDVILCLNIGKIDKVWFAPKARCFHIFREQLDSYYNNQIVLGKYIIVYRRMVYNKWYYKGLWPMVMLPGFLVIKIGRITQRIYKAGGGHFSKYLNSLWLFLASKFMS